MKVYLCNVENFLSVMQILKNHTFFKFNLLTDIACVDFLPRLMNRYELNYLLLSVSYNLRLIITILLPDFLTVQSSSCLFSNAN